MNASLKNSETGNEDESSANVKLNGVFFVDISDDPLLVARFLSPPDVCNLCLTNPEHFFCTAGNAVGTNTQEEEHRGGNAPDALFCNKLLRFSL
jgi:hypothetical protein